MTALSPRIPVKAVVFFLLWVALLVLAYWYFFIKPQQWFDASMQQPPRLAESLQQRALRTLLLSHFPQLQSGRPWFVRFRQDSCLCERFVELYHRSIVAQSDSEVLQVVTLELGSEGLDAGERTLVHQLIPSTPAVAVFDAKGNVVYFGPYHQDGICSADNSYLEPVLQALAQGQPLTVLNTLVFGCFCPT